MNTAVSEIPLSFSNPTDSKIAPIVLSAGVFVAKVAIGSAVGAAASWGTTRVLENRFPTKK